MQPRSVEAAGRRRRPTRRRRRRPTDGTGPWRAGPVVRGGGSASPGAIRGAATTGPYYRGLPAAATATDTGRASRSASTRLSVLWVRVLRLPVPDYAPYPYYGYPYGSPTGIPVCGVVSYPGGYGGYGSVGVGAYSGVRIQGAPPNAEVFADGSNVGIVDDFDGATQHLELTPGAHSIEIHAPGMAAMVYDVNVQPGRTVTLRVR